jgi:hypothetical protein
MAMVSLVAEIKKGPAGMNCRAAVRRRCGGGVPKPGLLQDGDGTDGRTGWPAVIRGRHEQDRSTRSVVFAWYPGKGVWLRARVPGVALLQATSSTGSASARSEGRTEGPSAIRIARTSNGSGYRRTSIVRWSPVTHPRSPRPRQRSGRARGNRRPAHYWGRQMV